MVTQIGVVAHTNAARSALLVVALLIWLCLMTLVVRMRLALLSAPREVLALLITRTLATPPPLRQTVPAALFSSHCLLVMSRGLMLLLLAEIIGSGAPVLAVRVVRGVRPLLTARRRGKMLLLMLLWYKLRLWNDWRRTLLRLSHVRLLRRRRSVLRHLMR
jgi:hypothetical protein